MYICIYVCIMYICVYVYRSYTIVINPNENISLNLNHTAAMIKCGYKYPSETEIKLPLDLIIVFNWGIQLLFHIGL